MLLFTGCIVIVNVDGLVAGGVGGPVSWELMFEANKDSAGMCTCVTRKVIAGGL